MKFENKRQCKLDILLCHSFLRLSFASVIILAFLLVSSAVLAFEPYTLHCMKNTITVKGSASSPKVVCMVQINGKSNLPYAAIDLYYTRLQQFSELQLYYKKNASDKKYNKLNAEVSQADVDDPMVITGVKRKIVYLPFPTEFMIRYKLKSNDLMLASLYNSFNPDTFDSLSIEYKTSNSFSLLYKVDGDSTRIKISKNKKNNVFTIYPKFKSLYYFNPSRPGYFFEPLDVMLRTMVVSKEFTNKPEDYFANWYHSFTEGAQMLDPHSKAIFDNLTCGMTDTLDITETIFQFIQKKINYVGLFSGWDAFIPRDVNMVLTNRYGDCKNMAQLLCSALKYKGIRAYYGITASSNYMVDMDFPSLSSGDHAICVVQIGEKWLFLDATYKTGFNLNPSPFIQGRTVLLVDQKRGFYKKIPILAPYESKITDSVIINLSQKPYKVSWNRTNTGYYASLLTDLNLSTSQMEQNAYLEWMFDELSKNLIWNNFSFKEELKGKNKIIAEGCARDNLVQKLPEGETLLFTDFIMFPKILESSNYKYEVRNQFCYLSESIYTIILPPGLRMKNPVSEASNNDFLNFSYSAQSVSGNEIELRVVFEFKKLIIPVSRLKEFDEISKKIFNTLHHAIIFN